MSSYNYVETNERLGKILDILEALSELLRRGKHVNLAPLWFMNGLALMAVISVAYWLWLTQEIVVNNMKRELQLHQAEERRDAEFREWLLHWGSMMTKDPKRSDSVRREWEEFKK